MVRGMATRHVQPYRRFNPKTGKVEQVSGYDTEVPDGALPGADLASLKDLSAKDPYAGTDDAPAKPKSKKQQAWEAELDAIEDQIVARGGYVVVTGRPYFHPHVGMDLAQRRMITMRQGYDEGWLPQQDYQKHGLIPVLVEDGIVTDSAEEDLKVRITDDGIIELRDADGEMHCAGGPAQIRPDGEVRYFTRGVLHRDDGPAVVRADGSAGWYRHGVEVEPF